MYCLASFCCVCLSNNNLQNINKTDIDDIPLISKLIFVSYGHEAIDLQIIKFICVDCLHMLRSAYKFKRTCLINNNLIKNFTCQLKYFTGEIGIQKNLVISLSHLTDNDYQKKLTSSPPSAEKYSPTLRSMKNDRISQINYSKPGPASAKRRKVENIEHPADNKLYKCKYCPATFIKHVVYLKHCNNNHKNENINSKSKETANIGNLLNNNDTIQLSPNDKQLPSNNIQSSSENSNSTVQDTDFLVQNTDIIGERKDTSMEDINSTVQLSKASQFKCIQCDYCKTKVRSVKTYRDHVLNMHGSKRNFICFICNIKLSHQCYYTQHMQARHVKVNYMCKECKKKFFSSREFERHMKKAHKKIFKCKICQKYFPEQRNLKLHIIFAHDKQNKNKETIENNETNSVSSEDELLQKPKKINFNKSKMVTKHLRGKMKCKNCLYTFSSSNALKTHICFKNKYMQQCKTCNIVYSKRKYLLKHMKLCNPGNAIENITDVNLFEPEENDNDEISTQESESVTFKQEESFEIKEEEILDENLFKDDDENSDRRFEIENIFSVNEFLETELREEDSNLQEQADNKDNDNHVEFEHLITLNTSDSLSNEDSHVIPNIESRNEENPSNEKSNNTITTENKTEQNNEITSKTINSTTKLKNNKDNTQTRKSSFPKIRLFENNAEENNCSINNTNTSEKNNINETSTDFQHSSKSMDNEHFEKFVSQFNVFNNTEFDEKIDESNNVTPVSNDRQNNDSTNSKNTNESDGTNKEINSDKDSDDPSNTKTKSYKTIFLRRKSIVIPNSNNEIKETLKVRNVSQINNDFKIMATTSNKSDSNNLITIKPKAKDNFKCHLCSKIFPLESLLNTHLFIHSESKLQCITCKTFFQTQFDLDRHIMITYQTGCYKNYFSKK